jgi:hypothetical protein
LGKITSTNQMRVVKTLSFNARDCSALNRPADVLFDRSVRRNDYGICFGPGRFVEALADLAQKQGGRGKTTDPLC